ncbi:MAG: VanZ family protein [Psychroflexus sp.]|nr:VanZ family protein [Psychroflexus sp.]MDN6309111.1 VanZ family protein [Psychroflexus sp.]
MLQLTKLISNKGISLLLLIIIGTAIPVLSLINLSGMPTFQIKSADKLYHLIAYASLSFIFALHYHNHVKRKISSVSYLGIFLLAVIFGIIIEVLQDTLTSYRTFDYFDILANACGALLGLVIISILLRILKFKK